MIYLRFTVSYIRECDVRWQVVLVKSVLVCMRVLMMLHFPFQPAHWYIFSYSIAFQIIALPSVMNACSGCEPRHMSRVSLRSKELQTGLRLPLGRASSLKARSAMMDRGSASLSKYLREVIDLPVPGFPPWWNEGSPDDGLKGPFQSLEHLTECSKMRKDYSVCLGVFDWHCWSGYTLKWNEMKCYSLVFII